MGSVSDTEDPNVGTFDESAFVARVEAFLDAHCPRLEAPSSQGLAPEEFSRESDPASDEKSLSAARSFQHALADTGLAGLHYPTEYGGAGLTHRHQELFTRTAARWRLPDGPLSISHGMCLPMLNQYGTHEQKADYLADNIRGTHIWCQMFSEPGAGSDVAGLSTRAVRDGDEWILDGQKVWTSGAHYCEYGLVVARTDPSLPKHQGLSMFIVDLNAPGVDVRPLVQISGARGFNEVFFDAVRIPASDLLGEVNQGWNLAVSMLMFERVSIGAGGGGLNAKRHPELIQLATKHGCNGDQMVRQVLADLFICEEIKGYVGQRIRAAAAAGRVPGPEGSIAKLTGAILARRTRDAAMAILGTTGQAWEPGSPSGREAERWSTYCISAAGVSIAGGTDEVQRNIIGERVLGLPKEPDPYKGAAWQDVPRN
ncbi:MAG: acyl-CoA dehydrogenase family protein [Actinomycetota bacterium]|nr:acyl-CoA dehydrogenase family protein [Actinomycetota bacterium]